MDYVLDLYSIYMVNVKMIWVILANVMNGDGWYIVAGSRYDDDLMIYMYKWDDCKWTC